MKIEKKEYEECLVINLIGKLDTQTSSQLQDEVDMISNNITNVEIDMLNLEYISSSGLRVLLKLSKQMKKKNGKVKIYNANAGIKEVFRITGFDKFLSIS